MANFIPKIVYGDSLENTLVFEFPPDGDPFGEKAHAQNVTTKAADGSLQNNQQYFERFYKVKISFASQAFKDDFDAFFKAWASLKKSFNYYPHSDVDDGMISASMDNDDIDYKRPLPGATAATFLFDFEFTLRTVE